MEGDNIEINCENRRILPHILDMIEKFDDVDDGYPYRHFATILTPDGDTVSCGTNTDRRITRGGPYARHAEMDAIIHLPPTDKKKRRKKVDLVVIRVNKSKKLKNSKPCFMCLEHIRLTKYYRIDYIFYSTDDGIIIREKFSEMYDSHDKHVSSRFR